jgi:hypothetical protein
MPDRFGARGWEDSMPALQIAMGLAIGSIFPLLLMVFI